MSSTDPAVDAAYIQRLAKVITVKGTLLVDSPYMLPWAKESSELTEARRNWETISSTMQVMGAGKYTTSDFMLQVYEPRIYQLWHNPEAVFDQLWAQLSALRMTSLETSRR